KRKLIVICCFFLALTYISGDSVSISEINNSSLLVNQTIKVNVNVTDRNGKPVLDLDKDNFRIFETPEGGEEKEREILAFEEKVNMDQGINMMLLLDNSRSMYSNDSGTIEDSPNEEIWRITHAKKAILSLLEEVDNSRDKIGLVPFNVKIGKSTRPKNNIRRLKKVLGQIEKPGKGEGYTELYESLHHTVGALSRSSGRKAIILLSDGENYPLANNRNFQEREGINGAIRYAQEEGVSVFTIGFGRQADEVSLRRIAGETGGLFFRARNQRELEALYKLIREQILNEYRITYR
ncbi:MAG: VWA domain-containing protein, partial [bacterium]|nr:VWA domain-containing protein [bacterium]